MDRFEGRLLKFTNNCKLWSQTLRDLDDESKGLTSEERYCLREVARSLTIGSDAVMTEFERVKKHRTK